MSGGMAAWEAKLSELMAKARAKSAADKLRCAGAKGWVVCGMGKKGRLVAKALRASGARVMAFVDGKAQEGQRLDGLPCMGKASGARQFGWCSAAVAVHNPQWRSDQARDELLALGFADALMLQEMVGAWPQLEHFWLAPAERTLEAEGEAALGLSMMGDEASRELYLAVLAFRLLGEASPEPEGSQYFPPSVPAPKQPLRWVDCGAYEGDTLDWVERGAMASAWCAAFEPDPANYAKLAAKHAGKAQLWPCGVSDGMRMASFAPDGPSGQIAQGGEAAIQLVSLDCALGDQEVNFLKMDIEGAELAALGGAAKLIARCQPRLALASYHAPEHMWRIPMKCAQLGFKGRYLLRAHAWNTFDTVVYGIEGE